MRFIKKFLSVFLAIALALSLSACKQNGSAVDFTCFSTYTHIQTATKKISKDTENQIKEVIFDLEKEFDANEEGSIVYRFNNAAAQTVIPLSDYAVEVFSLVKEAYELTDGEFDPTVYPLVKLWGFAPYNYTVNFTPPTKEQIDEALSKVGFDKLEFNEAEKTLTKLDASVKIDLGGIVKGYAVDLAAKILLDNGYTDGYISIGGSSLNLLSVDTLGIRHPRLSSDKGIITVNCEDDKNLSISTSGDYERYHKDADGNKYCHIVSAKTGMPASTGVASVTIMGIDGAMSDALTTAGCLLSYDKDNHQTSPLTVFLKDIVKNYGAEVYAVISTDKDKIILTNATDKDFTLNDADYTVKGL